MFSSSSGDNHLHQTSTIHFRLKSASTTSSSIQFLGRDIKVSDLKEKIGERLFAKDGGNSLQLWEASGNKMYTDANERVPAFTEILVVRTSEAQPGSAYGAGVGGGGGGGGATKEKTAGALGTMEMAKKAAAEAAALTRRAEIDFFNQQQGQQQQTSSSTTAGSSSQATAGQQQSSISEEEKLRELQDIVGRDMGVGSSTYGGRGNMNNNNNQNNNGSAMNQGGGGNNNNAQQGGNRGRQLHISGNPLVGAKSNASDFAGGQSLQMGGAALQAAPKDTYLCDLCGKKGHYIEHCPDRNGNAHHTRRFAQPVGIPESELEKCTPEEAMFRTRDGQFVRRKMMGLNAAHSNNGVITLDILDDDDSINKPQPVIKCMHCGSSRNGEVKNFCVLPCNCDGGKIACKKCVDEGDCLEMSDDGPVCKKCGTEIDADEIQAASIGDFPTKMSGQRRERK